MIEAAVPEVDDVLRAAQQRTGLDALPSETWREGLAIVLDELTGPLIHDDGVRWVVAQCVDGLAQRLRLHDYVRHHPEVLEEEVRRPLVVLGMPRTGTTVVSRLLDCDPARRSLLKWEVSDLVPPATTATLRTDPRCLAQLAREQEILDNRARTRGVMAHWEDADGPTECIFLHNHDFKSLIWDSWTRSTRYADWLLDQADMTSAYEYEKLVLQVLQSQAPGVWSLKMPSHAVHIRTLLKVFPDVRIVWAHRDPYKATGSLCNLLTVPAGLILDPADIDRDAIGQNAKRQMREHVRRPMEVRDELGDDQFFDLHYSGTMVDPIGQMRALYEWAGDTLTPDVEARMRTWLADNPQHKLGVSTYSLDQYGLSVAELEPVFADYLSRFDLDLEGAP